MIPSPAKRAKSRVAPAHLPAVPTVIPTAVGIHASQRTRSSFSRMQPHDRRNVQSSRGIKSSACVDPGLRREDVLFRTGAPLRAGGPAADACMGGRSREWSKTQRSAVMPVRVPLSSSSGFTSLTMGQASVICSASMTCSAVSVAA